jgi:phage-related protein (TIGR01555 family)
MAKRKRKSNIVPVADSFSNPAARLGFGTMDLMESTDYPLTRMTDNYNLLTSLYRNNWLVQNIVTTIPDDIVRKWYDVKTAIAPEYLDRLIRLERKTSIRAKILDGFYWARLYGGAAGLILIKGDDDMSKPLDINRIMPDSFLGLLILDRWMGVYPSLRVVTDPEDTDYGLPEYYTIRDEALSRDVADVHHSRIIRFTGRKLPRIEEIAAQYWGESEIEAVYQDLVRRDNVAANMASLTFRANVNYMEADGLDQLLSTGNAEMQRRFWNTMAAQSILESNFGMRVINRGDAIHNHQYTFTGLPEVYDRMMMDVSGACHIPVTKLFGRSAAGLNSTGESDMRNYYDYIDGLRDTAFRSVIEKLLPIMALSAWGMIPDDLDIDFAPMETANATELADVAQKKSNAIMTAYSYDLFDKATALKELQALDDEAGIFGKISDEDIEAAKGVYYSNSEQTEPFTGLPISTAEPEEPTEGGDVIGD